jgi:hypothetical protein
MNKETYEALKRLVAHIQKMSSSARLDILGEILQVKSWIDEVAKEYQEEKCPSCGEVSDNLGRCKCCNQDAF